MTNNDVRRAEGDLISTRELLEKLGCSRHKLLDIRRSYGMIAPALVVPPQTQLWDPVMVDRIREILNQEAQARPWA